MRSRAGLTVVELLLGLALGAVTLAAMVALSSASVAALQRATAGAETTTAVAGALDQMTRDIRLAGYDPRSRGIAAILDAGAALLETAADLDGDGAIDLDSEEHVTYRPSPSGDTLQRIVGRQSLPILSDLAPDGLRLRYFDTTGAEIDPATAGATATIRFVAIELRTRARAAHPAVALAGGARLLNR